MIPAFLVCIGGYVLFSEVMLDRYGIIFCRAGDEKEVLEFATSNCWCSAVCQSKDVKTDQTKKQAKNRVWVRREKTACSRKAPIRHSSLKKRAGNASTRYSTGRTAL